MLITALVIILHKFIPAPQLQDPSALLALRNPKLQVTSDSTCMSKAICVCFTQPSSLPKGSSNRKMLLLSVQTPEEAVGVCADEK